MPALRRSGGGGCGLRPARTAGLSFSRRLMLLNCLAGSCDCRAARLLALMRTIGVAACADPACAIPNEPTTAPAARRATGLRLMENIGDSLLGFVPSSGDRARRVSGAVAAREITEREGPHHPSLRPRNDHGPGGNAPPGPAAPTAERGQDLLGDPVRGEAA